MADLIDRRAAIGALEEPRKVSDTWTNEYAEKDPDVIKVIRCKDCKYCRKEDKSEYWCYGFCSPARLVRKDDFCSHGCKNE